MAAAENTRTQSIKGADTELDILLSTYSVHAATILLAVDVAPSTQLTVPGYKWSLLARRRIWLA